MKKENTNKTTVARPQVREFKPQMRSKKGGSFDDALIALGVRIQQKSA